VGQPFIGEIRMIAGNYAPDGWMFCEGQIMPISGNDTLFELVGTSYGGDGVNTFALPDLRGRLPIHQGGGFSLAQNGGVETVTLTVNQIPAHTHQLLAAAIQGNAITPAGNLSAISTNVVPYINASPDGNMNPGSVSTMGGSLPHSNLQPYLCVNFIISLSGIFPSQT
jgi:microcystin-dependent protein